jgi:hypothetical protein
LFVYFDDSLITLFLYSGNDCIKVMEFHQEILELVFTNKCQETKAKYISLWSDFCIAYDALMEVDDKADLKVQAANVQTLARKFGSNFSNTLPAQAAGLYFHIFNSHIGMLICQFGNLSKWSQQGLEHLHRWHKRQRREAGRPASAGRDCLQADIITRLLKAQKTRDAAAAVAAVALHKEMLHEMPDLPDEAVSSGSEDDDSSSDDEDGEVPDGVDSEGGDSDGDDSDNDDMSQ